jgi:tRNA threonylcarbamoyladenosine biosynthesis protein TsaB
MRILGIDTSTRFLSLGIYDKDKGVCTLRMDYGKKHSAFLLPTIKRVTEGLNIKLSDFDYFAVGLGPGSFTGMRIGLSVVKGMAYVLNKPLIGISSLQVLAFNAKMFLHKDDKLNNAHICPMIDAKRGLIFTALFSLREGRLKKIMPYKLIALDELLKKTPSGTVFLGDALGLYKEKIKAKIKKARLLEEDYWYPQPGSLIVLARERIGAGKTDNLKTVKPIYLYPKECQIKNAKEKT